jgi:hypothetical protein
MDTDTRELLESWINSELDAEKENIDPNPLEISPPQSGKKLVRKEVNGKRVPFSEITEEECPGYLNLEALRGMR